jgi:hypothetical protein
MAKIQSILCCDSWCLAVVTTDDAPEITQMCEGEDSFVSNLEAARIEFAGGEKREEDSLPVWVLGSGRTEQEAWEDYWEKHPSEAPEEYSSLKKRAGDLQQELSGVNQAILALSRRR